MKRLSSLMCLIFSLVLAACNTGTHTTPIQPWTQYTISLQHLLAHQHEPPIPQGRHYYFLVPNVQCKDCNFYTAQGVKMNLRQQLTIISGFPTSHFLGFDHYSYDSTDVLNTLPMVNYSNKILVTENGKVVGICSPHFDLYHQLDSLSKISYDLSKS